MDIFSNNGSGFALSQTLTGFNTPSFSSISEGGEIIGIGDLNEAIILKKHSNNTFYENQTIVLGVNVSALTTSKDGKYLMVGMANGASSIFLNSGTYTIVQQIND